MQQTVIDQLALLDWDRHVDSLVPEIYRQLQERCRDRSCPYADKNCQELLRQSRAMAAETFGIKCRAFN